MEMHRLTAREHRALRRAVEVYLDDEAEPGLAMDVRRHLERCWSCGEDAEWLVLVKASLVRTGGCRVPGLSIARLERFADSLGHTAGR